MYVVTHEFRKSEREKFGLGGLGLGTRLKWLVKLVFMRWAFLPVSVAAAGAACRTAN
jgi:hypothetical protein